VTVAPVTEGSRSCCSEPHPPGEKHIFVPSSPEGTAAESSPKGTAAESSPEGTAAESSPADPKKSDEPKIEKGLTTTAKKAAKWIAKQPRKLIVSYHMKKNLNKFENQILS
jgi:hypothetical protein